MKSLASEEVKTELLNRLDKLSPESKGRWGRMTVNQMLCHLSDTFILLQKDNRPEHTPNLLKKIQQSVMTWLALYSGLPAPRGIPTAAAVDQEKEGTAPIGFAEDKQTVITTMQQFSNKDRSYENCYHPIFGELSTKDWLRWGYVHVDHHFKQFGI